MGIIVNMGEEKSELQKKIAAELREKQEKSGSDEGEKPRLQNFANAEKLRENEKNDFVKDSEYMKDFAKKSSAPGWIFALAGIFLVVIFAIVLSSVFGGGK